MKRLEKYYRNPLPESDEGTLFSLHVRAAMSDWPDERFSALRSILDQTGSIDDAEYSEIEHVYAISTHDSDTFIETLKARLTQASFPGMFELAEHDDDGNERTVWRIENPTNSS